MAKVKPKIFRSNLADELRTLADILAREKLCRDVKPLRDAEEECRSGKDIKWGYEINGLVFGLNDVKNAVPTNVVNVNLELSVKVSGICLDDDHLGDPFQELEFNIVIGGEHNTGAKIKKVMCSWHLDRDLPLKPGATHRFMHPFYHFQHGGHHTWNKQYSYGAALILETPRFAHPPMDGILGVDFVLTNHLLTKTLEFREEDDYSRILLSAQRRVWRPYVHALATAWGAAPPTCNWPYKTLWPQLMP